MTQDNSANSEKRMIGEPTTACRKGKPPRPLSVSRLEDLIVKIPTKQLKRLSEQNMKKLGPFDREAQHFTGVTTMHGPLRVYEGRSLSGWFWILIMLFSFALLIYQVYTLVYGYVSRPVVSQVSFLIEENGMQFPLVTVCNFNPIKKSYIKKLNETGDFPEEVLNYLIQANVEMAALYSNAHVNQLLTGDKIFNDYRDKYSPNLTVDNFFYDGGFECEEILKICSFGGRKFNCCSVATPVLTQLGKCYTLNLMTGEPWMHTQSAAGEANGLQIILDVHLDEQFDGTGNQSDPVFTNSFENGFRYYIHAPDTVSFIASEAISVSPGSRVYSSIATNNYVLLSKNDWGNCNNGWPAKYNTTVAYSAGTCALMCKARFYEDLCGCTPFMYNVEHVGEICTPLQMYNCVNNTGIFNDGSGEFREPECEECDVECSSWNYHAYNSYGIGFSDGALRWLNERNKEWSMDHVKNNLLAVSVFFRDLTYTQYNQIQGTTITSTLSNIGGNMGLCFGMSIITIVEICVFLSKLGWICISKKRRVYMENKKRTEEEKEKQIDATISEYRRKSHSNWNTNLVFPLDNGGKTTVRQIAELTPDTLSTTIPSPPSSFSSMNSLWIDQGKERAHSQNISCIKG